MIKTLKIDNFRGIQSISIDNLSNVNVLVGLNGAGKTTVLEAIALLIGTGSEPFRYISRRRELHNARLSISSLFNDGSFNINPKITAGYYSSKRKRIMTLSSLDYAEAQHLIKNETPHKNQKEEEEASSNDDLYGLSISCQDSGEISTIKYALHIDHFHSDEEQLLKMRKHGLFYISPRQANSTRETANMLSNVQDDYEKEEKLYDSLRRMEPNLRRLRTSTLGGDVNVMVDFKDSKGIPINMMGDGFCRLVLILTGLYHTNAKTLIVDDVDSGMHYKNMGAVWKTLNQVASENGTQVFCVTHNEEMLKASFDEFKDSPDSIKVHRLYKNKKGHGVQSYDYDLFLDSMKMNMPIR